MVLKRMCGEEESRGKPADPGSPGRMAFKPVCGHSVASRYCNLIIYLYNLPADNSFVFFWFPTISVVLKKVLVLVNQFTSPCPRTSSPCPCLCTTKSLKIVKDFAFCKRSIMYDHVTSINSVTAVCGFLLE